MDQLFAEGGGIHIGLDDLLLIAKIGAAQPALEELILTRIAASLAEQRGLSISDEDTDAALSAFYAESELFEQEQIAQFVQSIKIDEATVRRHVRDNLLKDRLESVLISDAAVEQQFHASPYDYTTLSVQKILLPSRGAAAEILLQLNESEIPWEEAARRAGGMEIAEFRRNAAPPEAAAELFVCPPGGFVGPVEESTDSYAIYRVAWKHEATLDQTLRELIRQQLYNEEMRGILAAAPVKFLR